MTRRRWLTFLAASLVLLLSVAAFAALAPVKFLNTITPSGSFKVEKNISYGEHARHKLDIYRAKKATPGAPVLVFVHGGGWRHGDKDMYKFLAQGFTQDGYDVVVPNYRLSPDAQYPDMLHDTAKAVAHAAKAYPERPLVLMGHSAGAYNVMMMGLDSQYLAAESTDMCARIAGIISLAGPTGEIKLKSPKYVKVFPNRFNGKDGAINNVTAPAPHIMIANGDADTQVATINATGLAERIEARGGAVTLKIYANHSHNDLVKFLSRYFDGDSVLKGDITAFISELPKAGNFCR